MALLVSPGALSNVHVDSKPLNNASELHNMTTRSGDGISCHHTLTNTRGFPDFLKPGFTASEIDMPVAGDTPPQKKK